MKLSYILGALPFLGILGGVIFANRVEPFVLGMPFILFWIVLGVVLTLVIIAIVYQRLANVVVLFVVSLATRPATVGEQQRA